MRPEARDDELVLMKEVAAILLWQCSIFNTAELGKVVGLPEHRIANIAHAQREARHVRRVPMNDNAV